MLPALPRTTPDGETEASPWGLPNTRRGEKASPGCPLPSGKLAPTTLTDVLSSRLLRTTGRARPSPADRALYHQASSQLPSRPLWDRIPRSPLCTPPPAAHRQPSGPRRRQSTQGSFCFTVGAWTLVLKSTPSPPPRKCPHRAGPEPRPPARRTCGWNSLTFPTQNICARPMTLAGGGSGRGFWNWPGLRCRVGLGRS